jgi:N-acetylglucosaminyl-diphospho-decaprenol L-rhamnosyltransferase
MPRCSVIIVTYNSAAVIEACLRALVSQDCEIVVVDNASQDDTLARAVAFAEQAPLQVINISRNIGFAGAVNQGVLAANSDVLLILNPDAIAEPGAIDAIVTCFLKSGADAVGGALLGQDGGPDKGFVFRRLPTLASLLFEILLVSQVWPANPVNRSYRCLDADYSREQEIEQPAGACLAVTRQAWNAIDGMDEAFFPVWFEDVDFCARLRQSGAKVVYCPTARFHHGGAHSVGQLSFPDKQMFWYENMVRYARKHFSSVQVGVLRISILVGMGLRMLASLFGAGPRNLPAVELVRGYAQVAAWAIGISSNANDQGAH